MEPFNPKKFKGKGPERVIQDAIIKMLRYKGWHVMETHGNIYQKGFPDLFACHSKYGHRWIEVKLPEMRGSKFTAASGRTGEAVTRRQPRRSGVRLWLA